MSHHPIAGFGFLAVMLGGIGFLAFKGVESSRAYEADRRAQEALRQEEEAARAKEEAARARAEEIQNHIRTAVMAAQREDFTVAIEVLQKAADRFNDSTALWLNLGIAQRGAEQWDEAEKSFKRVLVLDPNDWDGIAESGTIRVVKGDLEGAFAFFERIPAGEGRMLERLAYDPTFNELDKEPRFTALVAKHGATELRRDTLARVKAESAAPQPTPAP